MGHLLSVPLSWLLMRRGNHPTHLWVLGEEVELEGVGWKEAGLAVGWLGGCREAEEDLGGWLAPQLFHRHFV